MTALHDRVADARTLLTDYRPTRMDYRPVSNLPGMARLVLDTLPMVECRWGMVKQIAAITGHCNQNVNIALRYLVREGYVIRISRGVYRLKERIERMREALL